MQNKSMILHSPFVISSRLLPAVKVGKSFVSIEEVGSTSDGRTRYQYHIDTPDFEYTGSDLKSGCGGGGIQDGMESLLSFLGAAGDSYRYSMSGRDSDNSDLFPANVMEWAYQNSDELSMLALELEEAQTDLVEQSS